MKHLSAFLCFFATSLVASVLAASSNMALAITAFSVQPAISPDGLDTLLTRPGIKVTVVDIRSAQEYGQGHIAGALSAPYGLWRGPADSPGTLPALSVLTEQVRQLGLTGDANKQVIVIVSSGANVSDFGAAARVYWTFKYLGLAQLSILNGGMQAWQQAQQPVSTHATPAPAPSQYVPVLDTRILATQADVLAGINQPGVRLIDARPPDFYLGKTKAPTALVAGTIKGAMNLAHSIWFAPDSTQMRPPNEVQAIVAEHFPDLRAEHITFCNTGHWAATDWFALSELAGVPNIRMYPESLAQWTHADEELPMDNTPSRGSQILKSLFGKS